MLFRSTVLVAERNPFDDVCRRRRLLRTESRGRRHPVRFAQLKRAVLRGEEVADRLVVNFEVRDGEGEVGIGGLDGDAVEEVLHDEEDDAGLGVGARDGVGFTAAGSLSARTT